MQACTLAGSGATLGATTIVLSTMLDINGVQLTLADFGQKGYATLEPSNGSQEEQISFTTVTANANGTTTLGGVKTVLFKTPFTESSGLAKSHPGGSKFIITNTAAFYDQLSGKADDETITGKWTFPNDDVSNAGIATDTDTAIATAFVTLGQLSRQAISGAADMELAVKGIGEEATAAEINAGTQTGSTSAELIVNPKYLHDSVYSLYLPGLVEKQALAGDNTDIAVGTGNKYVTQTGLQKNAEIYAATATGNDTYVITLSPVPTSLVDGMHLFFKADVANTGPATLNVNSLGPQALVTGLSTALVTGDIVANQVVEVVYNSTGTVWQVLNSALVSVNSYVGAVTGSGSIISTQNIDTVFTTTFTPKVINIYYLLTGRGGGVAKASAGLATFNGTVNTGGYQYYDNQTTGTLSFTMGSIPSIGTSGLTCGTEYKVVLSVLSVSATDFTIRAAFTEADSTYPGSSATYYAIAFR